MAGYSRNLFHWPIRGDWARRVVWTPGTNSPPPPYVTCWDMIACQFPIQPHLPLHISSIPSPQIRNLPWPCLRAQPITNCITSTILLSQGPHCRVLCYCSFLLLTLSLGLGSLKVKPETRILVCGIYWESTFRRNFKVWRKRNREGDIAGLQCGCRESPAFLWFTEGGLLYAVTVSQWLGAAPGKGVALYSQTRWLSSAKGNSPEKGQLWATSSHYSQ